MEQAWKAALAAVALLALGMALYVQLFERRLRQEESRLAELRLQEALAESRATAGSAAQSLSEPAPGESAGQGDDQPLPNAVLRRGESGTGSALQQFVGPPDSQQLLARLQERLETLSSRMEESDRGLRRDLDRWRVQVRRELDATSKVLTLLLVALIPLLANLLLSFWQPRRWRRDEERAER